MMVTSIGRPLNPLPANLTPFTMLPCVSPQALHSQFTTVTCITWQTAHSSTPDGCATGFNSFTKHYWGKHLSTSRPFCTSPILPSILGPVNSSNSPSLQSAPSLVGTPSDLLQLMTGTPYETLSNSLSSHLSLFLN